MTASEQSLPSLNDKAPVAAKKANRKSEKLPHATKPCKDCPFRKDSLKGWLGETAIKEILEVDSFTCHKTNKTLQCAGHMIVNEDRNVFMRISRSMKLPLKLSGKALLFDSKEDCIKHHSSED